MAEGSARGHSAVFLSPRTSELRQSVISYGSDQVDGATVVPPSDVPVSHSGNLQKIGRKLKLWKSRYFEVQGQEVYYYKTERKRHCLGAVDLKICYHVAASDAANFGYAFEVQTTARRHLFAARTEEDRQQWIDIITEKMGGKAVYEASKSTLSARTKTGRRPRGERNRTADNFPVMRRDEEEASPTNPSPETKRKSRMSQLVTRITSFKASSRIARSQRPLSYHPPARPSIEPVGEPQKPPVMKEQTVQVEVAPDKDTATTTPAQDDHSPPNIVVKEPTPTPQEEKPSDERGIPQHEGDSTQEGGTEPLEGNHVEPHPVVESTEAKPHPMHSAHTASSDREPSAPRDEPALHVEVQQGEEESAAAATAAVEVWQEETLGEGDTTVAAPLSTESANQEEGHTAATEREVEHTAATTQEPPASHSRAEPSAEVPTEPTNEVPTEPMDDVPTEPTDEVPTEPTDEVPAKPTDEVPTEPTNEVPTEPTDEVPAKPTDEVPTEPTDEVPTEPTDEVPTEPTDEVPAKPTDEVPTEPPHDVPSKPSDDMRTRPTANKPTKTSAGVKRFELPTVPTMPTLPADVREYLSQRFAADEIKEHLMALSSEGEEPEDLPLPPMYRSFSISCDHDDDYAAPSMDELRLFLADCA